MAVFAHPDDEAFSVGGVMRKYHDEGVRTALICATRGEAGEISDPALATPETLGQVREGELRAAAREMGIDDVSFLDYHDGRLVEADVDEAVGRIVYQLRRLRPQVVVTFEPKGGYGHPDHIAISRLTTTAFHKAGDPAAYPEQLAAELAPFGPQKLYYSGTALSAMRRLREELEKMELAFTPGGDAATIPIDQMGIPDEEITTTVVLTDEQVEAKMRGMQAHRTQMNPSVMSLFNHVSPEEMRAWRGAEQFVLVYPAGAAIHSETDLFAGVTL